MGTGLCSGSAESATHMMPTLGAQTFLIPFPEASSGKENCRTPLCNILSAESAENEQLCLATASGFLNIQCIVTLPLSNHSCWNKQLNGFCCNPKESLLFHAVRLFGISPASLHREKNIPKYPLLPKISIILLHIYYSS